jgi:hypothetical protein
VRTSVFHPTLAKLVCHQPQAALGTTGPDGPHVSMVLVVPDADGPGMPFSGLLLHLSRLAPHARYLEADPRAGLLFARIDPATADPQALPRVSVQGQFQPIARESADYAQSTARYLARFPHAVQLFEFDDFGLYRFVPTEAHYIGGSGQAFRLTATQFCALQVPAQRMTGRETG